MLLTKSNQKVIFLISVLRKVLWLWLEFTLKWTHSVFPLSLLSWQELKGQDIKFLHQYTTWIKPETPERKSLLIAGKSEMVSNYHDFWGQGETQKKTQRFNYRISFRDYELPFSENCRILCKQLLPHPPSNRTISFLFRQNVNILETASALNKKLSASFSYTTFICNPVDWTTHSTYTAL